MEKRSNRYRRDNYDRLRNGIGCRSLRYRCFGQRVRARFYAAVCTEIPCGPYPRLHPLAETEVGATTRSGRHLATTVANRRGFSARLQNRVVLT